MRSRSWMAAPSIALLALTAGGPARAAEKPIVNHVNLTLRVLGMSDEGCEIEVKPGNPACTFRTVVYRVPRGSSQEEVELPTLRVQSTSPDRNCAFDITIKETGHATKTIHRGLRLVPQADRRPVPVQSMTYYLTSPSLAARDGANQAPSRRRR